MDDVKEATIITSESEKQSFDDSDFVNWVNEGKPDKKIANRVEKRNAFYKLGINEKHIPCQNNYNKTRKQKLP